jgi:cation:H+ antiporter
VGLCLFPIYVYYLYITLRTSDGDGEEEHEELLVLKLLKRGPKEEKDGCDDDCDCDCSHDAPGIPLIVVQVMLGLFGIIIGAYLFVDQIEALAGIIGLNPLILALLVAPIATELPEMYNAIIWTRCGKDKFALGNITGSMVFQSCIPVTFGVLLTGWTLNLSHSTDQLQGISIIFALLSAAILITRSKGTEIKAGGLLLGGLFYATFIALVLLLG